MTVFIRWLTMLLRDLSSTAVISIALWPRKGGLFSDYFSELRMRPARSCEIVIMGYKMKLEQITFRETSVEFYGKRGISWYETVVLFRREDENNTVGDDFGALVLEHITEKDNAQDSWVVVSNLNAVMHRVKKFL